MIGRYLAVAMLLAGSAPLSGQTATTRLDAVSGAQPVDGKTQAQDVHIRSDFEQRMTVPVRLSGSGPYQFLVDTGADRTAVSRELVAKLALPSAGPVQLHSVTGVSEVNTARVKDVELTRPPENIDAAVLDRENIGADGIVGSDLLRAERVQFDFEKQTMTVVPSSSPEYHGDPGAIVVTARRNNGRLIITDADVDGQHLTVVLDTGADLSMGNEELRRRLPRDDLVYLGEKAQLLSVTGAVIVGDIVHIREMTIGGIGIRNLAVVITDAHTFKQLGLLNRPALLFGMNAMRAFKKVSIDFANRKFRVVMPEHSAIDTQMASRGGL